MLIRLFEEKTNPRLVRQVAELLHQGAIIIYPTDTLYAFGCDINNKAAVERIARLKGIDPKQSNFSIICADISQIAQYTKHIDTPVFKILKRNLPGPFTFILPAGSKLPAHFQNKRKQVGVRVPNSQIILEVVRELGRPILTSSLPTNQLAPEESQNPELIYEHFAQNVACVIDGGPRTISPSTIVTFIDNQPNIYRQGSGTLQF